MNTKIDVGSIVKVKVVDMNEKTGGGKKKEGD